MTRHSLRRLARHVPKWAVVVLLMSAPLGSVVAQVASRQRPATAANTQLVSSVFAAGTGGSGMTSANYRMLGVLGQAGLPTNQTTLSSQNFQFQPGFLAG